MRVIAGTCRGLKLKAPQGNTTRPTSDRIKESLFNIISNKREFYGACVLDICAGTGSLGIEALSRGAASCSFIEHDQKVVDFLNNNLVITGFARQSEVVTMEALKALRLLAGRARRYDLVFFDPPYDSKLYDSVPELLHTLGLLLSDSLFITECSVRNPLPESFGPIIKSDRRVYGDTALEFFTMEES